MIRRLLKKDRPRIKEIIDNTAIFTSEEKEIALELIDEALEYPAKDYYNVFVCEDNDILRGYHCTGRRYLTDGVYDLYWIVVDPFVRNKGTGHKLLQHAEKFVNNNNGRLILAETSSKDIYKKTRNFYIKNNYSIVSKIDDFYSVGDDLIIFGKYLIT